jgi:hypothetical protein
MNGFITVAIAHDATCEPGEEWLFHGMAKPFDVHGSLESPIDPKDKEILDRDMEELRLREAKEQADADFNAFGCIMAFVFGAFLVGVAIWALT